MTHVKHIINRCSNLDGVVIFANFLSFLSPRYINAVNA